MREETNYRKLTEVLGAVAVVLSLAFVGVEIRESNKATRSAMAAASVEAVTAWYEALGSSAESSALFYTYLLEPASLTPEQRFQATMIFHGLFLSFQNSLYLSTEGTLAEPITHSLTEAIVGVKDLPGFQLFWRQRRSIFTSGFQTYVDKLITTDREVSEGIFADVPGTLTETPRSNP